MKEQNDAEHRQISDYERAVCYYALSESGANVTLALILVYALCLLEAAAALIYGLVSGNRTWTIIGTVAFGGMVVFGVVAFTARALAAEIRRRRAIAIARECPSADDMKKLPDPFEDHTLLRRPLEEGKGFEITDRDGETLYRVRVEADGRTRHVTDADGNAVAEVRVPRLTRRSFALEGMVPRVAEVFVDGAPAGRIQQRFTLGPALADIVDGRGSETKRYTLRETGVFQGNRLVGRVYLLRDHAYLDIERGALGTAILGLFVALSYEKAHTSLL